jgi:hypothetical protein
MSGIGANTTQVAKWLGANSGKTQTTRNIKNTELAKLINQGIGDYGNIRQSGMDAFDQYYKDFMAGNAGANARSGQEVGVLDRYYNGGVENDLMGLRNRRDAATMNAAELASQRAIRGLNSSRLLGSGTPSSYDRRMATRYLGDIGVQQALDRTGPERADYSWLQGQQLGLGGRRQAMIDANTGRVLVPEGIRRQFYGQDLGFLGNLGEQDRANTFYGLKYKPSTAEEIGTALQNSINTMTDLYSMGMLGGAGGSKNAFAGGGAAKPGGGGGGGGIDIQALIQQYLQSQGGGGRGGYSSPQIGQSFGGYGGYGGYGGSTGDWANEARY